MQMLRVLLVAALVTLGGWVNANESTARVEVPAVVNINTADAETLALVLDGVGLSRARAIVSYREQHGSFASADELIEVKGIGERIVEANADRIAVAD